MKKVLRICSPQLGLSSNSNLGGEVHDYQILKGLANLGCKISILIPAKRPIEPNKNFIVKKLPFKHVLALSFNLFVLPYFFFEYKKSKFSIIRVHNPYFVGLGAVLFKYLKRVPVVATYHLKEQSLHYNLINQLIAKRFDGIVVVSDYLKDWLIKDYGVDSKKIKVISNGIDPFIRPIKKEKSLNFTILYVGLLIERKNPLFILKVLKKLTEIKIKCNLDICGQGPLENTLKQFAKDNHLRNVKFIKEAYREEKNLLYNSADLFAFPSKNEGFGLVAVEAMRSKLPVLGMHNSSTEEIVISEFNGYLLGQKVQDWVDKIMELKKDRKKYLKLSENAYKYSLGYDWQKAAKETKDYYEHIVSNG